MSHIILRCDQTLHRTRLLLRKDLGYNRLQETKHTLDSLWKEEKRLVQLEDYLQHQRTQLDMEILSEEQYQKLVTVSRTVKSIFFRWQQELSQKSSTESVCNKEKDKCNPDVKLQIDLRINNVIPKSPVDLDKTEDLWSQDVQIVTRSVLENLDYVRALLMPVKHECRVIDEAIKDLEQETHWRLTYIEELLRDVITKESHLLELRKSAK